MSLIFLGAVLVAAAIPVTWWALTGPRLEADVARNLRKGFERSGDLRAAMLAHSAQDRVMAPTLERLSIIGRKLTPAGAIDRLERRILLAGVPHGWTVERILTVKVLLGGVPMVLLLLRMLLAPSGVLVLLTMAVSTLGWFAPNLLLYSRGQERQQEIQRALPDTIDQITLTVEAGLGFDAAVARAAHTGHGPLPQELIRMLQDIQAGMSRQDALRRLVDRTDVPELRRFVLAVLQADGYGIPIAQVLRVQAGELRVKRRQLAEERAMKLPVKILFPLVLCIFPAMFIVLMGPAALDIKSTLGGM
jgi:tight adherence protein C